MNRKNYLLALTAFLLIPAVIFAQENKPQIKVGGVFFLATYYDTYKSVESREGVSYSFPMAPQLDEEGHDINKAGQFGMSVYQTRLHVKASGFKLLNADARLYVETDFLGSKSDALQMIRLRHAYLDLRWEKDELLFGQTNNVESLEEVTSGLLTSGAGSPIALLSRPMMIRYGRKLSDRWKTYAAVSYHRPQTGDAEAARNNGFPSVEGRIQYENSDNLLFGVAGSYKSMRPRLQTESGRRTEERIGSANVTAFLRYRLNNGYQIKFQGIYGSNLSHLGMAGGYGKRFGEEEKEDYGYTNFKGMSAWADFESKSYNDFYFGLFAGYMENLGAEKTVDPSRLFARHADLHLTGRIGPRIAYFKDQIFLGLEYSLFFSRWGEKFNSHYRPTESYDMTYNHRITLLVRYAF